MSDPLKREAPGFSRGGVTKVSAKERDRRLMVYHQTHSDGEAAKRLGLSRVAFRTWREGASLPEKGAPTKRRKGGAGWASGRARLPAEEDARRVAAYEAHASDRDAARALGVEYHMLRNWRNARGLAPKGGKGRLSAEERARRLAAYDAYPSDLQAAKALGLSYGTYRPWRASQGLPAKGKPFVALRTTDPEHERRYAAYLDSKGDAEAAAKAGVSLGVFKEWRRSHALGIASRGDVTAVKRGGVGRVRRLQMTAREALHYLDAGDVEGAKRAIDTGEV